MGSNRHWETFLSLIKVLNYFGCLDDLKPTEIGKGIGSLRGENELWIGLVLMSGHLDELTPVELAGVIQSIATEVNRPDLFQVQLQMKHLMIYQIFEENCLEFKNDLVLK